MRSRKKCSKSSKRARPKVTIGLDLGTKAGYCVLLDHHHYKSGGWNHTAKIHRKKNRELIGTRWVKFDTNLRDLIDDCLKLTHEDGLVIGYEYVNRHVGVISAHVFGGWLSAMELIAISYPLVQWAPYGVTKWKKAMTGSGRADKAEYIKAANKRYGLELEAADEDQAAACGVAYITYKQR